MDAVVAPASATLAVDAEEDAQLSRPILQQFYDCSNSRARISGMVLVSLYADRGPQAIIFHDAEGLAANAYLTQVTRALEAQFPGTEVQVTSQCLREDEPTFRDVRITRTAA
jgi:hypothetical protein